jgi:hypothetical protein
MMTEEEQQAAVDRANAAGVGIRFQNKESQ